MRAQRDARANGGVLVETLLVIAAMVVLSLAFRQIGGLFGILAIVYLLVERPKRSRTWADLGFKARSFLSDAKHNWYWIALVGVVIQFAVATGGKYLVPGFIEHVKSRIPVVSISQLAPVVILIIVSTFIEEVVYRGFFQERIGWFVKPAWAIVLLSFVFAAMHYAPGPFVTVGYDMAGVFVDSIVYGIIYNRSRNIFASWAAHFLADLVGLVFIIVYV